MGKDIDKVTSLITATITTFDAADRNIGNKLDVAVTALTEEVVRNYTLLDGVSGHVMGIEESLAEVCTEHDKTQQSLGKLSKSMHEKNKVLVKFLEKAGPYILIILSAIAYYVATRLGGKEGKEIVKEIVKEAPKK